MVLLTILPPYPGNVFFNRIPITSSHVLKILKLIPKYFLNNVFILSTHSPKLSIPSILIDVFLTYVRTYILICVFYVFSSAHTTDTIFASSSVLQKKCFSPIIKVIQIDLAIKFGCQWISFVGEP